jgi:hypothetical protein
MGVGDRDITVVRVAHIALAGSYRSVRRMPDLDRLGINQHRADIRSERRIFLALQPGDPHVSLPTLALESAAVTGVAPEKSLGPYSP